MRLLAKGRGKCNRYVVAVGGSLFAVAQTPISSHGTERKDPKASRITMSTNLYYGTAFHIDNISIDHMIKTKLMLFVGNAMKVEQHIKQETIQQAK